MRLARADRYALPSEPAASSDKSSEFPAHWLTQPPSALCTHLDPERQMAECCELSRQWLLSQDYLVDAVRHSTTAISGPRWLRERFQWGPCPWPLYWCEAAKAKTLDCGALSAIARDVFLLRGLEAFSVQLIQELDTRAIELLHRRWPKGQGYFDWLNGNRIYHEAAGVRLGHAELRIWDPTHSWWIPPQQMRGYGCTQAIRVRSASAYAPDLGPRALHWGPHRVELGQWVDVSS